VQATLLLIDAQTPLNGTGDDAVTAPNIDDEDAFTTLPNVSAVGSYNLTVPVTNTSGGAATLHAWIDFNKNDKFEAGGIKVLRLPTIRLVQMLI
jgi:hypothetical protein